MIPSGSFFQDDTQELADENEDVDVGYEPDEDSDVVDGDEQLYQMGQELGVPSGSFFQDDTQELADENEDVDVGYEPDEGSDVVDGDEQQTLSVLDTQLGGITLVATAVLALWVVLK
jgi:basic membrane lipoprotein Med (substrate-binding protein (PBP1-ABC) superfamily)